MPPRARARFAALRGEIPLWQASLLGALCLVLCGVLWWAADPRRRSPKSAFSAPRSCPAPAETFADFHSLWFEHALTRNTLVSLKRVVLGFGLAALVGIPLGVLCGCFRRVSAFFAPLMIVGRNIPVAAVIPLTLSLFGIGEFQKIMFIFIACVAFVVMDTATAIADVSDRYIDTAYTLGASRRQIVMKVLVPLAMPSIFNSLRLLFGLAFGYIMLAEVIQTRRRGRAGKHHQLRPKPRRPPHLYPPGADAHSPGGPGDRPAAVLGPTAVVPLPVRRRRLAAPRCARRHAGLGIVCGRSSSSRSTLCGRPLTPRRVGRAAPAKPRKTPPPELPPPTILPAGEQP